MVPTGQPVSLYYSDDFVSLDQEVKDLQAPKPEWGSPENSKLPKVEPFGRVHDGGGASLANVFLKHQYFSGTY